jgi:hypothetical protein
MKNRTRYFVILSLLITVVGLGTGLVAYYVGFPASVLAVTSGSQELRYVPRDATLVAYVGVREVMASELRKRLRETLPDQNNEQQEFQKQTGINIETDIDHIVAYTEQSASAGNQTPGMILARGTFAESKIEALMREHGARVEPYKNKRLMIMSGNSFLPKDPGNDASPPVAVTRPDLALSFLQSGLIAIGSAELVRRTVDFETSGDNLMANDEVMNLIKSLEPGNAWVVGRFDALRGAAPLPEGLKQLPAITWFTMTGRIADGISGVLRAETRDEESANNLRDLMRGFMALAKLQAGSQPDLQPLVQSLELGGSGKTVALSFSLPAQVLELLPSSKKAAGTQKAH